jgi:hypothetical protein
MFNFVSQIDIDIRYKMSWSIYCMRVFVCKDSYVVECEVVAVVIFRLQI